MKPDRIQAGETVFAKFGWGWISAYVVSASKRSCQVEFTNPAGRLQVKDMPREKLARQIPGCDIRVTNV